MKINSIDISLYSARAIGLTMNNDNIEANFFAPIDSNPVYYNTTVAAKTATVSLYIIGETRDEVESSVSSILSLIKGKSIVEYDGKVNTLECIFKSATVEKIAATARQLNIELIVTEKGAEQVINLTTASLVVNNLGTAETPLTIEITPTVNLATYTVAGVTITGLTLGKKIVIDGNKKLITEDGVNKFADCSLVDFPKLKVGANTIAQNNITATVKLMFAPQYI